MLLKPQLYIFIIKILEVHFALFCIRSCAKETLILTNNWHIYLWRSCKLCSLSSVLDVALRPDKHLGRVFAFREKGMTLWLLPLFEVMLTVIAFFFHLRKMFTKNCLPKYSIKPGQGSGTFWHGTPCSPLPHLLGLSWVSQVPPCGRPGVGKVPPICTHRPDAVNSPLRKTLLHYSHL